MNKTDTNHHFLRAFCIIHFLLVPHRASCDRLNHHPVKYLEGITTFIIKRQILVVITMIMLPFRCTFRMIDFIEIQNVQIKNSIFGIDQLNLIIVKNYIIIKYLIFPKINFICQKRSDFIFHSSGILFLMFLTK